MPSGFLPDEDQGAFMAELQLPDAASTNRTLAAVEEVEKTIAGRPWLQSIFTVSGYSLIDGLALPNRALVVVELKPFDERKDAKLSVFQALKELNIGFSQIAVGQRLRLQPAADHGPGQFVGLRVRRPVAGRRLARPTSPPCRAA